MAAGRRAAATLIATAGALALLANFHTSSGSALTVRTAGGSDTTTATTTITSTTSVGTPVTAGAPPAPPSSSEPASAATPPSPTAPATSRAAVSSSSAPPSTVSSTKQVDGPVIGTPYGDVQVRVVLRGTKIVDVQPLTLPSDRSRSRRISERAAPLLRTEALQAQSANIDLLSGASYTSEGYAESLQGALDNARS